MQNFIHYGAMHCKTSSTCSILHHPRCLSSDFITRCFQLSQRSSSISFFLKLLSSGCWSIFVAYQRAMVVDNSDWNTYIYLTSDKNYLQLHFYHFDTPLHISSCHMEVFSHFFAVHSAKEKLLRHIACIINNRVILHEMVYAATTVSLCTPLSPTVCRASTKKYVRVVCVFIIVAIFYCNFFLVENRNSRKCLSILHGIKIMQVLHTLMYVVSVEIV